jgi:ABC-type branched-subunit amino acid transport system substrate-binding protein
MKTSAARSLAAKDINAAGGVNGRRIVLSIEDDACDPKQAVSVANHVVGEQITLVDGHSCSNASLPASPVYAEYSVLMMTPSSVNSKLTDNAFAKGWPTIMRLYVRDDNQGKMLGAWMADRYRTKKIAFVHDKSTYGKSLADQVKANLNAAGVHEILYEGINPGEKDYGAIIGKLKAVGAEVLYYGGYPTEGGLIVRQAADQGAKFQMVATSSFVTPEFWLIAGSAGEGTLFPAPRSPMDLETQTCGRGVSGDGLRADRFYVVQLRDGAGAGGRRATRWQDGWRGCCAGATRTQSCGHGVRPGHLRRKRGCRRHDLRNQCLAQWPLRETALKADPGSVR